MPSKKAPKKPKAPAKKPAAKPIARSAPKSAAKPAVKPATKKPAPKAARPAAKAPPPAKTKKKSAKPAAPSRDTAELDSLRAHVVELHSQLEAAQSDRQSAMERLADLEARLAESASVEAPPQNTDDEHRLATALAEKANAVRQIWELERDLESTTAELERERAAHAEARNQMGGDGRPDEPSASENGLRHRIAELETSLAEREEEVRSFLPTEAGELIACPRCHGKMVEFEHLGVTLDRCTACAGLFFDAGELAEVIRREYPDAATTDEATSTDSESPSQDTKQETNEERNQQNQEKKKGFFRSLFGRKE